LHFKTDGRKWLDIDSKYAITARERSIQGSSYSSVCIFPTFSPWISMLLFPSKLVENNVILKSFNRSILTLSSCREDFGSSKVLSIPEVENITVLGGGKSSADMVYSAVKAGKKVNWVLKATDTTGPGFFLSPEGKGPYKNAFEIAMTRLASTFTPSFMNGDSWWTRLLHSTKCGAKIMGAFWSAVDAETRKEAVFEGRDSLQGFELLSPQSP
jgi:hypothetical protein